MYPPSFIRRCEAALDLYLAPWQKVEHGDKGRQALPTKVRELAGHAEGPSDV